MAERIEGAPPVSVGLVDDPCVRTLALPSGTILLSTGALAMVEDEAELAFVLGHEIAHAASGEAAVRLTRLGFRSSVGLSGATDGSAWFEAASDLVQLGYGRLRERDADERAVEALLALGYDPEAALRHLRRLDGAIASGTSLVADAALAHPAPEDRIRRIERTLYGRTDLGAGIRLELGPEPFWPERELKQPREVRAIEASLRAAEAGLLAGIEALKACRIRSGWLVRDGRKFTAEDLRSAVNSA